MAHGPLGLCAIIIHVTTLPYTNAEVNAHSDMTGSSSGRFLVEAAGEAMIIRVISKGAVHAPGSRPPFILFLIAWKLFFGVFFRLECVRCKKNSAAIRVALMATAVGKAEVL